MPPASRQTEVATVLDRLRAEAPEGGGVAFAGSLGLLGGRRVRMADGPSCCPAC